MAFSRRRDAALHRACMPPARSKPTLRRRSDAAPSPAQPAGAPTAPPTPFPRARPVPAGSRPGAQAVPQGVRPVPRPAGAAVRRRRGRAVSAEEVKRRQGAAGCVGAGGGG
eukprot:scaffold25754_cov104-Isochrysis_galbana.AAC.6